MRSPTIAFSCAFLAIVFLAVSVNAQPRGIFSPREEVEASVRMVPCKQDQRLEGVRQLFKDAGASDEEIRIESFDKGKTSNLVVHKKGESDETIIIGAHYDRTDQGCGVVDNWTGVAIISHIYRSLRPLKSKKSYIFVAFDREEEGLVGSRKMADAMTKDQKANTCSMVNFDSFGGGPPMALRNASSSKMVKLAEELGTENNFKFQSVTISGASSDSASFKAEKIPSITLSGLGSNWPDILHTSRDKTENVNIDSVFFGYSFGMIYLAKLDASPCDKYR